RRYRAVALTASALAIVVSLGPQTPLYAVLHENLVFVRGVRALSRFSLLPVLCLDVLAGLALSGRPRWMALVALAGLLVESSDVVARSDEALSPAARFGEVRIYQVPPGEAAAAAAPGRAGATLWTAEGPVLDLGEVLSLDRVVFEVSDGDWIARPRVALSLDG